MKSELFDKLSFTLEREGIKHGFASGFWGSFSRSELTPLSDIDILCFVPNNHICVNNLFNQLEQEIQCPHRIDIVVCDSPDLVKFSLINGLNLHSVFFLNSLLGDPSAINQIVKARRKLQSNNYVLAREIFNVLSSYCGLSASIFPSNKRWAKLSYFGTNRWVKLTQAFKLRFPDILSKSTQEILQCMSHRYNVNEKEVVKEWQSCFNARKLQERSFLNKTSMSISLPQDSEYWAILTHNFIQETIPWLQANAGVPIEILEKFVVQILGYPLAVQPPTRICSPTTNLLIALVSKDENTLEKVAAESIDDWWVCSTLAANPNTPPQVLEYILFTNSKVATITWQTIRLYVASNLNTSVETLKHILATPNLRDQDYEAAMLNLRLKN